MNTSQAERHNQQKRIAYSIKEVCELTTLSKSKVYLLISAGSLKTTKVGKRTLVSPDSVTELMCYEAA